MTNTGSNKKRSNSGVVCSFRNEDNGNLRLIFDDVSNSESSITSDWKHEDIFIWKDYDPELLENFDIPKNELAEIGQCLLIRILALRQKRIDRQKLISDIHDAFKDAEFPSHLGLIAAESIDDWVTDKKVLKDLTLKHDFHGPWWEIPESHLKQSSLGLNYVDSIGMAFYLPAIMTLSLKESTIIGSLIEQLDSVFENDTEGLYEHFCNKMSKIDGKRKKVCIEFMNYMKEILMLQGHIYYVTRINKALKHEFWNL